MLEYVCISTAATVKKICENVKKLPKMLHILIMCQWDCTNGAIVLVHNVFGFCVILYDCFHLTLYCTMVTKDTAHEGCLVTQYCNNIFVGLQIISK